MVTSPEHLRRVSTRCSRSIGAANSRSGKGRQHLPTMGTLLWIDAPGCQEGRDRARPIEGRPPRSLRSATDRRIVPSSRSPILERRRLRVSGGRSWNNNLIDISARPAALEAIPGLHRHKVRTIKALPVTALIQIITGTGIRWIEELWPRSRDDGVLRTLDCASPARPRDAEPITGPLSSSDDRVGPRTGS